MNRNWPSMGPTIKPPEAPPKAFWGILGWIFGGPITEYWGRCLQYFCMSPLEFPKTPQKASWKASTVLIVGHILGHIGPHQTCFDEWGLECSSWLLEGANLCKISSSRQFPMKFASWIDESSRFFKGFQMERLRTKGFQGLRGE